ncbi:MAG: hypothetical protein FJZ90_07720 [Chloroflexi bacterium]|nr:hypothetical protein [Chloroflexota bacterium]
MSDKLFQGRLWQRPLGDHAGSLSGIQRSVTAVEALLGAMPDYSVERLEGSSLAWRVGWRGIEATLAYVVASDTGQGVVLDFFDLDWVCAKRPDRVAERWRRWGYMAVPTAAGVVMSDGHGIMIEASLTPMAGMVLRHVKEALLEAGALPAEEPEPRRVRLSIQERRDRVRELAAAGLTAPQMAARLGCGESTVRLDCQKLGIKLR